MTKVHAFRSTLAAQGQNMTAGEMAAAYGCTRSAIYKLSTARGFKLVSDVPRKLPEAKALRALVKKRPNTTAADLIERFGVTPTLAGP